MCILAFSFFYTECDYRENEYDVMLLDMPVSCGMYIPVHDLGRFQDCIEHLDMGRQRMRVGLMLEARHKPFRSMPHFPWRHQPESMSLPDSRVLAGQQNSRSGPVHGSTFAKVCKDVAAMQAPDRIYVYLHAHICMYMAYRRQSFLV